MKKFLLLIILFSAFNSFSQGTVRGKITDENGESLFGVRIFLKNNKTVFTSSDFDGNYSVKISESTPQTLVISYTSFETIEQVVNVSNNEIIIKDFTLQPQTNEIKEVNVVVKKTKAKEYYMENVKINSATTIDYVSSETMKKTGDANVTAAVARVSGVSTNGGMITVRGIGDRYVKTTLNGSRIPTLDPLTNNIKLDIFPSSLVDNIIITKTASPDLPGDFSGAYLSVETKDYPEKLEVNVESQFGYNDQTSFKEIISSQRSKTDWLGFDNGLRKDHNKVLEYPNLKPTTYEEMKALGLGNYYANLGVDGWIDGSPESDTYFRLGLVELGILPRASINDPVVYKEAKKTYNETYKSLAFDKINPDGKDYNNGFSNNWNTIKRKAPLNFSQSFSIGNQTKLFGKPLGYLFGFRYGNSVRYDPNGISQRVGDESLGFLFDTKDKAQISRETNGWSSLFNLAYKLNDKNSVSILFMPNFSGTNDVASFITDDVSLIEGRVSKNQFYEQRKQLIYQLKSEHYIEKVRMKIDYNASFTKGNSIAPDFKVIQYATALDSNVITGYQFAPNAGDGIRRYFRYLDETILDTRLSAELPLSKKESTLTRKIKFGGAYQKNNRNQDLEEYLLSEGNNIKNAQLSNDDLNSYLSLDRLMMKDQTIDFFYNQYDYARNHTIGNSSVLAGYGLLDFEIIKQFRFSGGLRVEQAKIFSDVLKYYNLGYERNDIRRENVGGFPNVNAANIDETSFLPSLNLIYKIKKESFGKMNVRANYSKTIARPSIRELNDVAVFDNEFRTLIYGNSDLKTVQVKNYDFRAESFFNNGDNISISLFYKDFTNHIEMGFGSSGITWQNIENSNVKGFEFEGKKSITKYFDLKANVTLVNSNSEFVRKSMDLVNGEKIYTPIDTVMRPMFGQAPYIINGIASFKADSLGLTATLSYNIQGPRLVITGVVKGRPDVYELPRNTFDFKVSKTLGKHFSTSLTIRDILNAPVVRAYKLPNEWIDFDRFRYGTNFVFGISYKL